jgi:general L-amino acid transport system substrate-binding protein
MAGVAVLAVALAGCETDNGEVEDPADELNGEDTEGDEAAAGDDDGDGTGNGNGLLQTVQDRGELICGVNDAVAGFGLQDEDGEFDGFDVDYCRVIAAGVLGDADAVEYVPLTAETRITALQAGEVDVLSRNTTFTATRDGSEGLSFATTTFYDGQGMMVREDSDYQSLADMDNTAICVLSGTTTELNLETAFSAEGLDYEALTFEDNDAMREAFLQERCDGWTSDMSQLAAHRSTWPDDEGGPDALRILDETMSKEPLGPAVVDGDDEWFDAVNWSIIATMIAEEFEITSENVQQMVEEVDPDEDPNVADFLGVGELDPGLGLDPDFAVNIVEQVGNYEEIYDRHVGPDTDLGLERGYNALYLDGGLHYPPPYV